MLNTNGDWGGGGWADPIGVFTEVLRAEFCRVGSTGRP